MKFAKRTGWDQSSNPLTRAHEALLAAGTPVLDLTESNPTRCGFDYAALPLTHLSDPHNVLYEPQSRGMSAAREAVGRFHQFSPDQVVLTASTSESYAYLFRLLLDPGDKVLIPKPSYPLFQFLLELNDAQFDYYPLVYDGGWRIDFPALERLIDRDTKAVVLVNPNNPTGSYVKRDELDRLNAVCRERGLVIISDEVFFPYRLGDGPYVSLQGNTDVPTFVLGGLSKSVGLPQMKLGWMLVSGPGDAVQGALGRLDIIADTFLSVNTPVQRACGAWLAGAPDIQGQILARVKTNLAHVAASGLDACAVEGGWYAVLRLGDIDEEEFVLNLLTRRHILAHPGFFFDFDEPGRLVASLLPKPEQFARMMSAIKELHHA